MAFRKGRWVLAAAAVVASAAAVFGTSAVATADTAPPAPDNAAAPFAVEDWAYPGADEVLQSKGITLTKGDGRINLVECTAGHQIEVYTRETHADGRDRFCFAAAESTGFLTMSIPDVYAVQTTNDRALNASVTADGETKTVAVPKGWLVGVGEGSKGGAAVLLELRVTA